MHPTIRTAGLIAIVFAAGIAAAPLIGQLHAQTASPSATPLVLQATTQSVSTVMPVAFILDADKRRVMACRAPASSVGQGPSCSSWTDLAR